MGGFHILLLVTLATFSAQAAQPGPADPASAAVSADIYDIRGPLSSDILAPFVVTGGMLVLAAGLFFIRRNIRQHESTSMPDVAEPHLDANDLLAGLATDFREGACSGEHAVIRLDGIVRGTIAARTRIPAQQLTSAELSRSKILVFLDQDKQALLNALLMLFDQVKFAGKQPDAGAVEEVLDMTASFLAGFRQGGCHEVP